MPAPSNLPFDVDAFIEQTKSTLTPEQVIGIKALATGYMSGQDYNRNLDRMKNEYAQRVAAEDQYHNQLTAYEQQAAEAITKVQAIEQRFGPIDKFLPTADPNVMTTPSGDYVARSEVNQLVKQFNDTIAEVRKGFNDFAEGTYHMVVKMPRYSSQYEKRYNEEFDGKAFMDFLDENRIADPDIGYKLFTADKETAFNKVEHERALQAAKEEGAREFATRNHIASVVARPLMHSPLMQPIRPQTAPVPVQPQPSPQPQPPIPAAPVPAVPTAPLRGAADLSNDTAIPLAQRMQERFMAVKDQP